MLFIFTVRSGSKQVISQGNMEIFVESYSHPYCNFSKPLSCVPVRLCLMEAGQERGVSPEKVWGVKSWYRKGKFSSGNNFFRAYGRISFLVIFTGLISAKQKSIDCWPMLAPALEDAVSLLAVQQPSWKIKKLRVAQQFYIRVKN